MFQFYLYLLIISMLVFFLLEHLRTYRESMRTLPRPVINEAKDKDTYTFTPSPPYDGETLNTMIDRMIHQYFDKRGFPYSNTIELYKNLCVNQGNVNEENKRKLTDIGYYVLNIVIPNIQTTKNPEPEVFWPAISWTNKPIFDVLIQPTVTYDMFKGQAYSGSYTANYTSSRSQNDGRLSTRTNSSQDSRGLNGAEGQNGSNSSGSASCGNDRLGQCGIQCPSSCLDGVAASWYKEQNEKKSRKNQLSDDKSRFSTAALQTDLNTAMNTFQVNNTTLLPGADNVFIIGSAEMDGYQILDEPQTSDTTTLNDNIENFIDKFFIKDGPNSGKPTQHAIDLFDMYFQYKTPMDDIHMNKLRDVVYYILQVIVPGLPTDALPRSYVEWRPIVWLSRSSE